MILVDANLLLYAYMDAYPQHRAARTWLNEQLNGAAPVGLPWATLLAFLRISTNPRAYTIPSTVKDACLQVEEWLALSVVQIPEPGPRHGEIILALLRRAGTGGKLVSDAHLAALAIEHGLMLCSADTDFARFPGLRWSNPLASA